MNTSELAVSIDGEVVPPERAVISVFDRQFLYGDGIYETLRTYDGNLFASELHLHRLRRSSEGLELPMLWSDQELLEELQAVAKATGAPECSVRLMVTRGEGTFGLDPALATQPRRVMIARPVQAPSETLRTSGIDVVIPEVIRNSPQAIPGWIKSGNYLNQIRALAEGRKKGAFEVILQDVSGWVTEGSTSNVFWVTDGVLFTPWLGLPVLPGVTRALVLTLARHLEIPVEEGPFPTYALWSADEAFITSTLKEILPIRTCEGHQIGARTHTPVPGPVTRRLQTAFHALTQACAQGESLPIVAETLAAQIERGGR